MVPNVIDNLKKINNFSYDIVMGELMKMHKEGYIGKGFERRLGLSFAINGVIPHGSNYVLIQHIQSGKDPEWGYLKNTKDESNLHW